MPEVSHSSKIFIEECRESWLNKYFGYNNEAVAKSYVLQQPHSFRRRRFLWYNHSWPIKNRLRRRLAGNLGGKSADSASVEDGSPLLQLRLDLPPTLPHDPSAGREQTILNAAPLVARRIAHARFCLRKTKSDKITFSNYNFLPMKKIEKQTFFWFYGVLAKHKI